MKSDKPIPSESSTDQDFQPIRDALRGLRFGTVNIIIQDGLVVQIDRTEKLRLRGLAADSGSRQSSK